MDPKGFMSEEEKIDIEESIKIVQTDILVSTKEEKSCENAKS